MLSRNLRKKIVAALICVTALLIISPSALATEPHENPEKAKPVFSGIYLLRYYSDALDFVLRKNPAGVEARLKKMPFANIPKSRRAAISSNSNNRTLSQSLEEATYGFAFSGISISHVVVEIDEGLDKLRALREQFRLSEAVEQAAQISARLYQANHELERIQQAVETIGDELNVSLAPAQGDLWRSYMRVWLGINRIREMLALYQELLESTDLTLAESLESTGLTMEVKHTGDFVGDNIRFEGVLTTSEGKPLAGRMVNILLNSLRYITVKTDAYGHYRGTLQIPYRYIPELDLQALYYPQDKDIGVSLASLSPVIKRKVLFHEGVLKITVKKKAYPGLETTVTGRFDHGQYTPLNERKVEIYFDDVLITEIMSQETFAQEIKIDPEVDVGEHIIFVSSAPVGRYASVNASVILNVTRATPILDISIPKMMMIPGSVGLQGKLYSEVGPLNGALIKMGLGKSQVELVSSEDGAFNTKIKVVMGLGVIGSQSMVIQILPQEPWHAPLNTTRSVLMVNVVNGGAFIAILLFLGIYLPRRLKRRLGAYTRRRVRPEMPTAPPELAPAYSERVTAITVTEESKGIVGEPRDRIFYWYRLVAKLLQGITKTLLKPQQTLREFAEESSRVLEPAAKYFIALTKMVEKLLYSQYSPKEADVDNSKQLSYKIEEETKLRATTQLLLTRQLHGEVTKAQFESNEIAIVGGAKAFELGSRVLTNSSWRQLATWLWVVLILTVAWYACILLFLLPLLVASLAYCLPLVMVDDSSKGGTKAMTKEESKGEGV